MASRWRSDPPPTGQLHSTTRTEWLLVVGLAALLLVASVLILTVAGQPDAAAAGAGPVPTGTTQPVMPAALGWAVLGLVGAVAWAVTEHRRWRKERDETHDWRTAYWHLLATARCPLCGTRAEPESTPAAEPEPSKGEL